MKRWPLRVQITLLVGMVLTLACVVLTMNSIFSAQGYYSVLDDGSRIGTMPEGEMIVPDQVSSYAMATRLFSIQSASVMVAAVLCSVALTYWLTGRLLRPLTGLTASIRAIDQGRLHQRVKLPRATGEVRELMESFNGMLDRLEDSFEMQKNFAANAAHELKTPLAVLKTSLQVLEMDDEPSLQDYREFTEAAGAGIDRLTDTVYALMALAQGDGDGNREEVSLRPLLELIFSELGHRAEAGGVSLSLSGDCPPVSGDPTLLYRAVFNLVENAVKYTPPGGKAEVRLSRREGRVRVQVSDNGIGMAREAAAHAFEPFYRADRSRSQKIPGAGLGLSVVKAIAERHHGNVFLESTEGVGTIVTLIL